MHARPTGHRRLPRRMRLRKQRDFERVYRSGRWAADAVLVIKAIRNDLGFSRLGLSVSRRVGNAVVRNRWKRLIREAFRQQRPVLPAGLDLVVRPKRGAPIDAAAIRDSLRALNRRVARQLRGRAS